MLHAAEDFVKNTHITQESVIFTYSVRLLMVTAMLCLHYLEWKNNCLGKSKKSPASKGEAQALA